jgi:hypothetical protein
MLFDKEKNIIIDPILIAKEGFPDTVVAEEEDGWASSGDDRWWWHCFVARVKRRPPKKKKKKTFMQVDCSFFFLYRQSLVPSPPYVPSMMMNTD